MNEYFAICSWSGVQGDTAEFIKHIISFISLKTTRETYSMSVDEFDKHIYHGILTIQS